MPPKVTINQLREAFVADLTEVWQCFREKYRDHTPYALALFGAGMPAHLIPVILTEESLTQVARYYFEKDYSDTLEQTREEFRFAVGDSPLFDDFDHLTQNVEKLFKPIAMDMGDEAGYRALSKAASAALKELDTAGLFGAGSTREKITLFITTDEVETNRALASAAELNPQSVAERFTLATQPAGPFTSCDKLVLSADGRSLFTVGSTRLPASETRDEEASVSQIAAYDVVDARFKQRWTFEFPSFGDSCRTAVESPDDQSIVVLRQRYKGDQETTMLMRFSPSSNRPVRERAFSGSSAQLAISHDGSRIAVTQFDRSLTLFDRDFNQLYRRQFRQQPYGIVFLDSGHLLVGSLQQILKIDAQTGKSVSRIARPGFTLNTDAAQSFLVAGGYYSDDSEQRGVPFGFSVLKLPSFKLHREFSIADQQLVKPVISPDGTLVAVQADEPGKMRQNIVVFDTATGEKVAERRDRANDDWGFCAHEPTLVIAQSVYGKLPVLRWPIPGRAPTARPSS